MKLKNIINEKPASVQLIHRHTEREREPCLQPAQPHRKRGSFSIFICPGTASGPRVLFFLLDRLFRPTLLTTEGTKTWIAQTDTEASQSSSSSTSKHKHKKHRSASDCDLSTWRFYYFLDGKVMRCVHIHTWVIVSTSPYLVCV